MRIYTSAARRFFHVEHISDRSTPKAILTAVVYSASRISIYLDLATLPYAR
jgi:hypothetical protein